jgi:putative glutathione S-transferase
LGAPHDHFSEIKKAENAILISFARPTRGLEGWIFENGTETSKEHLFGKTRLHEVYTTSHPDYTGRVTVPMLWDKKQGCMVNNGVYKTGYARSQDAYEESVVPLF